MKDELAVVLEAMRRAQAKVAFYLEPGNRDPERAFKEMAQILDDPELMNAMRSLYRPRSRRASRRSSMWTWSMRLLRLRRRGSAEHKVC